MSSIIKVNTYQDANGNALFSSDGSGNVTTSASGLQNTPAFQAKMSADQTISDDVYTKVQFNTEDYDTNSMYDTSTYRFTPTTSGKYFIYTYASLSAEAASELDSARLSIYLNGTEHFWGLMNMGNNFPEIVNITTVGVIDMNGSTDYIEVFARINDTSGSPVVKSGTRSRFGAYRLIGA